MPKTATTFASSQQSNYELNISLHRYTMIQTYQNSEEIPKFSSSSHKNPSCKISDYFVSQQKTSPRIKQLKYHKYITPQTIRFANIAEGSKPK